jgi:hypothetical protein
MKKIEAQYLRARPRISENENPQIVNSNLNENPSKCNCQIETSKPPNLQNPKSLMEVGKSKYKIGP